MLCCSRAINSNGSALARPARFTIQTQLASLDSKSPRFSHTSVKCWRPLVTTNVSLKPMGRQTLHTQWFPRHSCAEDTFRVPVVPPWAVHCGPCRLAKRYECAANSFAALLGVFVAHPFRTLQIAKTPVNVSSNRLSACAFGRHK